MTVTEIPLSRRKLHTNLFACLVFVLLGIWLITGNTFKSIPFVGHPAVRYGIGGACTLVFAIFAVLYVRMIRKKQVGLTIAENGITDGSNAICAGFVPWGDIEAIEPVGDFRQQFALVVLRNPDDYIRRGKNAAARGAMKFNYGRYGTPIVLTAQALQCTHDELVQLLQEGLAAFNEKHPQANAAEHPHASPTNHNAPKLDDLYNELVAAGASRFCIVGFGEYKSDDVERLEYAHGQWEVNYVERGQKELLFATKDKAKAINYYRNLILGIQHWHLVVFTRSKEKIEWYREKIRELGIEPIQNDIPYYDDIGGVYRLFVVNKEIFTVKEHLPEVPYFDEGLE